MYSMRKRICFWNIEACKSILVDPKKANYKNKHNGSSLLIFICLRVHSGELDLNFVNCTQIKFAMHFSLAWQIYIFIRSQCIVLWNLKIWHLELVLTCYGLPLPVLCQFCSSLLVQCSALVRQRWTASWITDVNTVGTLPHLSVAPAR